MALAWHLIEIPFSSLHLKLVVLMSPVAIDGIAGWAIKCELL